MTQHAQSAEVKQFVALIARTENLVESLHRMLPSKTEGPRVKQLETSLEVANRELTVLINEAESLEFRLCLAQARKHGLRQPD